MANSLSPGNIYYGTSGYNTTGYVHYVSDDCVTMFTTSDGVTKPINKPEKPRELALDNLSLNKILLYSFLGLTLKVISDKNKEEKNDREIGS